MFMLFLNSPDGFCFYHLLDSYPSLDAAMTAYDDGLYCIGCQVLDEQEGRLYMAASHSSIGWRTGDYMRVELHPQRGVIFHFGEHGSPHPQGDPIMAAKKGTLPPWLKNKKKPPKGKKPTQADKDSRMPRGKKIPPGLFEKGKRGKKPARRR